MSKQFCVGGVEPHEGGWRPVFEMHCPCDDDQHTACVVTQRVEGPRYDTEAKAVEVLLASKDTIVWSGPGPTAPWGPAGGD